MMMNQQKNRIWAKVKHWRAISRQRNQLKTLSADLAIDMGISRVDLDREASRPFWDNATCYDGSLRTSNGSSQDSCEENFRLKQCLQP